MPVGGQVVQLVTLGVKGLVACASGRPCFEIILVLLCNCFVTDYILPFNYVLPSIRLFSLQVYIIAVLMYILNSNL